MYFKPSSQLKWARKESQNISLWVIYQIVRRSEMVIKFCTSQHNFLACQLVRFRGRYNYSTFHAWISISTCNLPEGAESNTRRSYFPSCPALYRRSSPESQTTVTLWSLEPCLGTNITVPTNPSPLSCRLEAQSGPLTTLVPGLICKVTQNSEVFFLENFSIYISKICIDTSNKTNKPKILK